MRKIQNQVCSLEKSECIYNPMTRELRYSITGKRPSKCLRFQPENQISIINQKLSFEKLIDDLSFKKLESILFLRIKQIFKHEPINVTDQIFNMISRYTTFKIVSLTIFISSIIRFEDIVETE